MENQNTGTSDETKTIVTVLLLIFVYPAGVIVMWLWTKWKTWVKVLVSLPALLIPVVVTIIAVGTFALVNPSTQITKARMKGAEDRARYLECMKQCALETTNKNSCISNCFE